MNNPDIAFLDVVVSTIPFLWSRTVAGILMTVGHLAFAVRVADVQPSRCRAEGADPVHSEPGRGDGRGGMNRAVWLYVGVLATVLASLPV